jgi:hypothetical protein
VDSACGSRLSKSGPEAPDAVGDSLTSGVDMMASTSSATNGVENLSVGQEMSTGELIDCDSRSCSLEIGVSTFFP